MSKDGDFSEISYLLGILSIVLSFFQPVAAFILGIVGLIHSKKQKTALSEKAKKFNIIGIILSIIFFVLATAITAYFTAKGLANLPI